MSNSNIFLITTFVALSFLNIHTGTTARNLLQMPPLPLIPNLPKPTLPSTMPTLPQPTLPTLPTTLPKPTLPPLPNMPTLPKVALPPMPNMPSMPTTIPFPSIPFFSPPPSP